MSEYEQKNLFALFGNLRFRRNINQGGMGLGLTAANLICKVLRGNLKLIRSEKNNGSKFNFTMQVRLGSDIVYTDETSNLTENYDQGSSPLTSTKRVQTHSTAQNLNDMLLRQTSLATLEKTFFNSQQEYRYNQQDGEMIMMEDHFEQEEGMESSLEEQSRESSTLSYEEQESEQEEQEGSYGN